MDLGFLTTHTDLALDARDMAHAANQGQPIPGIEQEFTRENGIRVTKINVLNEEGSKALGKLLGSLYNDRSASSAGERQPITGPRRHEISSRV